MFGTSGIRGAVGTEVTAALALAVGRAVASEGADRVVVGRDVRDSGRMLTDALAAGVRECGSEVVDLGVESTPTVARSIETFDADAGVVITASHNPPTDNGIKLWTPSGKAFGPERRDGIARRVEQEEYDLVRWDEIGERRRRETARDAHATQLVDAVDVAEPPQVVLDLGNGAGTVTASVLQELGCRVLTLNGNQDGAFPGRPSEPTRETLEPLAALVAETDAALGLAHDGDADRLLTVDGSGRFVPKDVLFALFAREAAGDGDRVAAPIDTSLAVDDALAAVGASVTRTQVGDVFVAERATEPDVTFGGEPSGAWIWPEETLCPDGPLAACKLVELVAKRGSLANLVDGGEQHPIRRTSIETAAKERVMDGVRDRVRERFDEVETLDGVRVEREDGWFLVRASGTQPLVRVTAEGRSASAADDLFEVASDLVTDAKSETGVDE